MRAGLLCLAALAALPAARAAGPAAAPAPEPLRAVAFLEGRWVAGGPGEVSEEVWTPPSGGAMQGLWRYVVADRVRAIELSSITAEPTGLVLRLRHFDGKLEARETKDMPVTLKLVKEGPGEVRFEGITVGDPRRGITAVTYRRSGPDGLVASVDVNGRVRTFEFRRAGAPGARAGGSPAGETPR